MGLRGAVLGTGRLWRHVLLPEEGNTPSSKRSFCFFSLTGNGFFILQMTNYTVAAPCPDAEVASLLLRIS